MTSLKREFEKLIDKKRVEIADCQRAIAAAEAYIQAMTDAIKKLPKDDVALQAVVRKGSEVERIRDLIVAAARPLHLDEIVEGLGRAEDSSAKAKVAGTLGWYTSKGKVFTKTAPNTYGLIDQVELPPDFGSLESAESQSEDESERTPTA